MASSPPRAVLDTSVLLSAERHWLWLLARLGYFEAIWSTYIVGELVRVRVEHSIARKVPRAVYRERLNALVHSLSEVLLVADYRQVGASGLLHDPDDDPILSTALASQAGFIVTFNTRDFPPGDEVLGVRFRTPEAFAAELYAVHPTAGLSRQIDAAGRQLP